MKKIFAFLILLFSANIFAQNSFWDRFPSGYWMDQNDDSIAEVKFSKDNVFKGQIRDLKNDTFKTYEGRYRFISNTIEIRIEKIITTRLNGKNLRPAKSENYRKRHTITYSFTNMKKLSLMRMPWSKFNREYIKVND